MKRILLLVLLAFMPAPAWAQLPANIVDSIRAMGNVNDAQATSKLIRPLFMNVEPPRNVSALRDINYGSHPQQKLDVYTSDTDKNGGRPILIFVHGGNFTGGDKHRPGDFTYDNVMIWAVQTGFIGVNTNYRLAPQFTWPAAAQDIANVVRWAKDNGEKYGGDPNKIFIWGHSAGGAIVADYVSHSQFHLVPGSGLKGAIMTSGVGFELPAPSQYAYYADSTKLKDMESLPGLLKTNVPLFITRAEFDPPEIAEGVERLNKALCDAGRCPAVFGRNQGENHMSQIYSVGTVDRRLTIKVAAFIRELAH